VLARLIDRVVRDSVDGSASDGPSDGPAARARAALDRLSPREREVAHAVAAGKSNVEIGVELFLSTATVKAYVSRLLAKLECANRVQVAILVHEAAPFP
jgi:DNA-binding NarL/FixJ family response regulator